MKVIDAHLHFSDREGLRKTSREISQVDYSFAGLKKEFSQGNVVAGVVMTAPDQDNNYLATVPDEFSMDHGNDFLLSCLGINPVQLEEDKTLLDRYEKELAKSHVTGIKIYAGYFHYYVYDPVYEPIYELAKKYNVPVAIHCGDTQWSHGLLKYSHPLTIDELAVKHQEINFIICHLGVPWVMDTAELILKNPNVFADVSGLIAGNREQITKMKDTRLYTQFIQQGLVYANRYDKILFGSDWPLVPIAPYIDFIKHLIPEEYHQFVFYKNALALFPKMKNII
ncbi:MAG: amidohydrolase family protein [Bacillota bacterium]